MLSVQPGYTGAILGAHHHLLVTKHVWDWEQVRARARASQDEPERPTALREVFEGVWEPGVKVRGPLGVRRAAGVVGAGEYPYPTLELHVAREEYWLLPQQRDWRRPRWEISRQVRRRLLPLALPPGAAEG